MFSSLNIPIIFKSFIVYFYFLLFFKRIILFQNYNPNFIFLPIFLEWKLYLIGVYPSSKYECLGYTKFLSRILLIDPHSQAVNRGAFDEIHFFLMSLAKRSKEESP